MKVMFKTIVEKVDMSSDEIKKNGLKYAPQGPMKVREQLEAYLDSNFNDYYSEGVFPEEVSNTLEEGHRRTITVNKYERSFIARQKCIEEHGLNCTVCDMNFEKVYGEVGKGFIHVHHVVPLHEVGGSYKVDYRKDLVPVCPNCHAMLHSSTVEELKELYKNSYQ